ncbi:MAG: hypothetical protein ACLR7F_09100 [Waltera sp.]
MSFLMAFCLYEKGFREMDFNFSWGYMYGIFCICGSTVGIAAGYRKGGYEEEKGLAAIQWLAYLWHLVCGLYYFWAFYRVPCIIRKYCFRRIFVNKPFISILVQKVW